MAPQTTNSQEAVAILRDLFEKEGSDDYLGEPVSKTVHSCQAGTLAELDGQDTATVIGSFLHDIGHLVGERNKSKQMCAPDGTNLGIVNHGVVGAEFLKTLGFPPAVTVIVQEHVNAKKYLCYKLPVYHDNLSDASKATLICQGGPMTEKQAIKFQENPYLEQILKARSYDEKAKDDKWTNFKSVEEFMILIEFYLKNMESAEK